LKWEWMKQASKQEREKQANNLDLFAIKWNLYMEMKNSQTNWQ
jgi:hypothetical protein